MKKKILVAFLCACTVMSFAGCGGKKDDTQTTEVQQKQASSADYKMDYAKQVKNICDYSAIPVQLSSQYDITDEAIEDYFSKNISSYGSKAYHEITDRTTVAEDDYVDVNYTGYKDGEAFEGGAAENVLIDLANNCNVGGSGYIDGFSSGIVGAKVGDEIDCDVTFPEDYNNADLAGQAVVFKFKINGIYDKTTVSLGEIDDEFVKEVLSGDGVSTVEELREKIVNNLESMKKNAASVEIVSYLVENCEVEIPEEYLKLRLDEYVSYIVSSYGATKEEAEKEGKSQLEQQIKEEIILGYIAEKEGIKFDEEGYNDFITNYTNYYGMAMQQSFTQEQFYEIAGYGNATSGEKIMKNQYVGNLALDKLAENAQITFVDESADEPTEETEE